MTIFEYIKKGISEYEYNSQIQILGRKEGWPELPKEIWNQALLFIARSNCKHEYVKLRHYEETGFADIISVCKKCGYWLGPL